MFEFCRFVKHFLFRGYCNKFKVILEQIENPIHLVISVGVLKVRKEDAHLWRHAEEDAHNKGYTRSAERTMKFARLMSLSIRRFSYNVIFNIQDA